MYKLANLPTLVIMLLSLSHSRIIPLHFTYDIKKIKKIKNKMTKYFLESFPSLAKK